MRRPRGIRSLALAGRIAAATALACVGGCHVFTDRDFYEEGETGSVTLVNQSDVTGYLPGCQSFQYEKLDDGAWVEQPPDLVCVWEGTPLPVPPRSELRFAFTAHDAGRWRLRFDVGVGCDAGLPLSQAGCADHVSVVSNVFEVREPLSRTCQVSGCSGELCAPEPLASVCVFLPHYACFRDAVCSERGDLGPQPGCGWERGPELEDCLARFGASP